MLTPPQNENVIFPCKAKRDSMIGLLHALAANVMLFCGVLMSVSSNEAVHLNLVFREPEILPLFSIFVLV